MSTVYTGGTLRRFEAKVDRSAGPDGCHWWLGAQSANHGHIRIAGRVQVVSRVALEVALGRRLRDGHQANHHCDNGLCVNPRHLYEGTQRNNIHDAMRRGRHVVPPRNDDSPPPVRIGEANNKAVMTEEGVRRLREERARTGATYKVLAERWGISRATVAQIVRRVTWKEVMP